ncbi:GH92 family glycosyl hydrolase [Ancylomarina longa]|uniref:Glycoside hydrolase family 92 protein n=1 Tax=Ancylomarina longa TaxID=2487017 RepID=A0A434AGW9_9BACT|nr:GH92 family glycosyl hydrolase [Ancylomarina longa]RUT73620.1 glycoside hydrolase family 92 protein [Ancylomarina longa]
MRLLAFCLAVLGLFACSKESGNGEKKFTAYVNTFVGTDGSGNTYPGAVVPFGMVQLSPDNGLPGWDRIAGYFWQDSTIAGFSHTHLSGTGAGDMYDLLIMPMNSRFTESLTPDGDYRPYSKISHDREEVSPGYYKVDLLSSGITAELTTTKRVGFHRYTFPKDTASTIILDLGYKLNWDNPYDTKIIVENDSTISGYRKSNGWAKDQQVYFTIQFSKAFDHFELQQSGEPSEKREVRGTKTKFIAHFPTREKEQILLKVALSYSSIEGARRNMIAEIPNWDFDATRKQADEEWNTALSRIEIEGSKEEKELFYTNLYHVYLTPSLLSDVDGRYIGADRKEHIAVGFDRYDTFSLWDTYRAAHPLYTILCPDKVSDFVQSFLSQYDETGLLPVWSLAGNESNMMIGYHAVPVIVDAYFKGIEMDAEKAYLACKESAMENGRQIPEYMKLGYVPAKAEGENWSVSKTLEYAFDDWCIAQFAKALNKQKDYKYFLKRGENWKYLYDSKSTFFRPKDAKGQFLTPFDPKAYTNYFCESNAWQYFWYVPQDIPGFIKTVGEKRFAAKLDSMFTYYPEKDDDLPIFSTGMIGQYAHGNEPSHHVAYLFNYIGQPEKTQELVRRIINTQYSTKPDGYCGNEDCGQMSAWLVFSSLGMYPVNPANGVYDLTSPSVAKAVIHLPNGKTFTVSTENQGKENYNILKVLLNGVEYNKSTITHQQLMKGGELHFVLSPGK